MAWTLDNPQTDAEWFKEFVRIALTNPPTALPEQYRTIGCTEVVWFEAEPHVAVVQCKGGGPDERKLAEWIVREELGAAGYRQASFTFDGSEDLRKTAAWPDIMAKAKRLIQSGNVRILRNGFNIIAAHVVGDHGEYNCDISRDDPSSRAITQWTCECPWDQYAWQRTRKWKKYEGRPCAHVLAAYWQSLATPLDDYDPNQHGPLPNGQKRAPSPMQMQKAPTPPPEGPAGVPEQMGIPKDLFNQVPTQQQPIPVGQQPPSPGTLPNLQMPLFSQPPSQTQPFMAPPEDQGVIPPFPGAMQQETQQAITIPISVPGGRPGPYPANPIQQPFTFSRVAAAGDTFNNSDMVRLEEPLMGVMEGPKPNQFGDGQYREIPQNSIGEVLGQDQTTGWVDVIFPLHDTGPNEPYHVRAWIEPEKLTAMPGVKKPGPFIKRVGNARLLAMAIDPNKLNQWIEANGPYLYHGAHPRNGEDPEVVANSILTHGLIPNEGREQPPYPARDQYENVNEYGEDEAGHRDPDLEEWWHHPRPGHVFMITNPDWAYGSPAFRVDLRKLDPVRLKADDDYLRDSHPDRINFHKWTDPTPENPPRTLGEQTEALGWGDDPEDTYNSLEGHGVIAHEGPIPPEAIERIR
jgi:hypothetical protein